MSMKSAGAHERAEIGEFSGSARAEEEHQPAAFFSAMRRRRHSVIARIGADPVPVQIIISLEPG